MLFHDYGMQGIYELARVTALPVQTVARVSPAAASPPCRCAPPCARGCWCPGTSSRPNALRPPWICCAATRAVWSTSLHWAAQPCGGDRLHLHVPQHHGALQHLARDGGTQRPTALVPELGVIVDRQQPPGLVPQTLAPLLEKRLAIKPAWRACLPGTRAACATRRAPRPTSGCW
jgi:hypothetical protein